MFIGQYYHTIEPTGRISLPKIFRDVSEKWIVTRGLDGGLFLFLANEFEEQISALQKQNFTSKKHRDFARLMVNSAHLIEVDSQGRVLIPVHLVELADLDKDVVIAGSYGYLEMWDRDQYHSYLDQLSPEAEQIAESLNQPMELN